MPVENLPGERIESLVDELEGIIEEARPPFGKGAQQKIIETDVFFNILDEIRMSYPEEWQKSRRILKEREELLASAAAQADSIIADAQQQRSPSPLSRRLCVWPSSRRTTSAIVPTSTSARPAMLRKITLSRCSRTLRRILSPSPVRSPVAASS